jgi:hypothetical protein
MENIDFVLWNVLWPIAISVCSYLDKKQIHREPTEEQKQVTAVIQVVIWIWVACLLWH